MLSNVVALPPCRGKKASRADVVWSPEDNGWYAQEWKTEHVTKLWRSEEEAIRAARRREWAK